MANFCPKCRRKTSPSDAFCPDCGSGLPKLDDRDSSAPEEISEISRSGFENKKHFKGKPIGTFGKFLILAAVAVAFVFMFNMFRSFSSTSSVRNCIGSVNGGAPECSDCEKVSRKTTLNGKSLGNCIAVPGTGSYADQCSLDCGEKFYGPKQ